MSRPTARRRRAQEGFTLVELLMAIVLSSIFAAALYGFFFAGVDAARTHESQARAQATGREALDRMARDMRQAISPDDGVTAPVIAVTPISIELYVDTRRTAAATKPVPQKVRYRVAGTELVRERQLVIATSPTIVYGAWGGSETMIESVKNGSAPIFSALSPEGVALPSTVQGPQARDVAQVSVRLLIGQRTGNTNTTLELRTDVALRNAIRF
jgi:prepilin-type N-terminal cleavage/methylation domain-containing protein